MKIGLFVDVQNIYYTTRATFKRPLNYRKLWQQINNSGDIHIANAYAIEPKDDQQRKFQDALRHIGFEIKLKPYIQRSDGSAKGDWDVGITIDMLENAEQLDKIILLSGDGDFDLLVKKIRQRWQCLVQVIAVEALTAQSLINACHQFTPIDQQLLN